jgi:hypothetical protein
MKHAALYLRVSTLVSTRRKTLDDAHGFAAKGSKGLG